VNRRTGVRYNTYVVRALRGPVDVWSCSTLGIGLSSVGIVDWGVMGKAGD
jgi:hypothetical protein